MVWLSQAPFRAVTAVLAPPAAPPVAVGSPHSTASNSLILASTALGSASSGSKAGALRSWLRTEASAGHGSYCVWYQIAVSQGS